MKYAHPVLYYVEAIKDSFFSANEDISSLSLYLANEDLVRVAPVSLLKDVEEGEHHCLKQHVYKRRQQRGVDAALR